MVNPIRVLARHPYFAPLPAAARDILGARTLVRTHARGALIFVEGEHAAGLHLVASGAVRVFKAVEDGREQVLHHVLPGQSFNDVAAFDGGPSPASAQAIEPTTVLLVPRDTLLDLMRAHPEIAVAALQALSVRLRQLSHLVEDLSRRHIVARVAGFLLRPRVATGDLPTRQELAAMVGTVREVATRALRHLERAGAIRLGPGRRVAILDRRRLQRLSGGGPPHRAPEAHPAKIPGSRL